MEVWKPIKSLASIPPMICPDQGVGRPAKVTAAKAAFLVVVKEQGKETTYRDLASSDYVKKLGISKVHYTTIHKAVKRLPSGFLETVMRLFGERVSKEEMDCVFDATGVKIRRYEKKIHAGEERRERQGVKLNSAWDADEKVFHASEVLKGKAHEYPGSEDMFERINTPIENVFADTGFAGRTFVQTVADSGAEPVVKPPSNATPKAKGSPAWRKLVKEYQELGYEKWRDETGYGERFPNEGQFGSLVSRVDDKANVRSTHMGQRVVTARLTFHNFFQWLVKR
ncbi:hypothetical protein AKJ61_01730 [candidate division MSBL1 archaeon SCGC-AAA259B11]|uniref:Transposase IS4-like domain-containing protein n=1 Tax=candidate division MSBL1 archaeon SCGC-AAA259B11 TaxID=1698260 RepID=A0A133U707_9EURY|nr:hypothetical protein AKJ61_01730 [candidate division MSBL1 archaeon SCGC-AAA259B11]